MVEAIFAVGFPTGKDFPWEFELSVAKTKRVMMQKTLIHSAVVSSSDKNVVSFSGSLISGRSLEYNTELLAWQALNTGSTPAALAIILKFCNTLQRRKWNEIQKCTEMIAK